MDSLTDVVLVVMLAAGGATAIQRVCNTAFKRIAKLPVLVQWFLFLQWAVTCILVLGIVGKQRLAQQLRHRGLYAVGYWGDYVGGTQGTVFSQCTVEVFADYLQAHWDDKNSSIDNAVDQLLPMAARERSLAMYSTNPNLVQHIGLLSSHAERMEHISRVSSLSFED